MGFIKKWLLILFLTLVFVVALLVAMDNSTEVALKFMGFATPVLPVSWWLLLVFVLGTLFGIVLNVFSNIFSRARLRLDARASTQSLPSSTSAASANRVPED